MVSKNLRKSIAKSLMDIYGYGEEKANAIIEKHIDVVEANMADLTAKQLADQLEEQEMQGY